MTAPVLSQDEQKRRVGEAAAALVERGAHVGLGTGSTAAWFIRALGARNASEALGLRCTATSEASAKLAREVGLDCFPLEALAPIDITVDGADEIGAGLSLIKGAGGALFREKLVWEASRTCVVIADGSKLVDRLGQSYPLPVEVVTFGHPATAKALEGALVSAGAKGVFRHRAGVTTDNGNVIYDLHDAVIPDPVALGDALKRVTGVVEHGLFLGLAKLAIVDGGADLLRLDQTFRSHGA